MRRGDVVTVATGGGFGGKPRPAVIVQADSLGPISTIVVALITSEEIESRPVRPWLDPSPRNGLRHRSQVMIEVLVTAPRGTIGGIIGALSPEEMTEVDLRLLLVLGLA